MKLLLTLAALILSAFSFSQNIENQDKLIEKYGSNRYNEMMSTSPRLMEVLDYRISNGYVLIDEVPEKFATDPVKESFVKMISKTDKEIIQPQELLNEINSGTFNILLYNFTQNKSEDTAYRIGEDHVLLIRSVESITRLRQQQ